MSMSQSSVSTTAMSERSAASEVPPILLGRGAGHVRADIDDHHFGTRHGQPPGTGPADPARPAGDQRPAARQIQVDHRLRGHAC